MINLFKAHPMNFTPFSEKQPIDFMEKHGLYIVDNPQKADIFVSINLRSLIKLMPKFGSTKKYLIWTMEPRDNTYFTSKIQGFLGIPDIHIMNLYTEARPDNNYSENSYGRSSTIDCFLNPLNEEDFPSFKHKKIAALMVCRNNKRKWSFKRNGQELDLCYLRSHIALEGYNLNKVDIYGKGWPKGIALEVSRGGEWTIARRNAAGVIIGSTERKAQILSNYHFNLCFENTNWDYYCTEKIWESIKYGCLPIYYGEGNKIYEDFPKNSFLDYCEFNHPQALFNYIDAMDVKEFRNRMNLCINVFNDICEKRKYHKHYDGTSVNEKRILKIVDKVKEIMN